MVYPGTVLDDLQRRGYRDMAAADAVPHLLPFRPVLRLPLLQARQMACSMAPHPPTAGQPDN